ncbi:MAG: bifunctional glutamate N-acetyltransferase/amino-acid acetyltransferase ArgJ [Planctomycetes bacterium]|nr:bifunctional glutamate N-acetyltransferase/amino-acid acetyltransferase ArgJ [Planctomycetota bacterium]
MLPHGFEFAGVSCGIKTIPGREDLSLVVCRSGAVAAGVYTTNRVFAAPVALDRERTPSSDIRVVITNSGNANACTGERGLRDAQEMARLAATAVGAGPEQALVMSTGVIGEFLPMDKIAAGIASAGKQLGGDEAAFMAAVRGMMTTDRGPKVAFRTTTVAGRDVRLAGMAKGAGMIGPKMATMLGVITTDAALSPESAQAALAAAVEESFNAISVEGHMSTNDTVLLLAGGAAGGELIGDDLQSFQHALTELCTELAKQIPDDGEGATHLIAIDVRGCGARKDADAIARAIANSALVKTAVHGGDPNWGRIVSAAGYAGVAFDPAQVSLCINGHLLYERGAPAPFDAAAVSQSMKANRETTVVLSVGDGPAACRHWTSDLTVEYVKFNADYHT